VRIDSVLNNMRRQLPFEDEPKIGAACLHAGQISAVALA
jgi:hypothetical protein